MKKRAILRVLGYARRYWLYLAGAVGGAVASVALTLLAPVIIGAGEMCIRDSMHTGCNRHGAEDPDHL